MTDPRSRLISLLSEESGVHTTSITETSSLRDDLGLDSLQIVEVVMVLEEELEIELLDDDTEGNETVGDLADAVEKAIEKNKTNG